MAIPDYQSIMYPLLKMIEDGKEYRFRECVKKLAIEFEITEQEKKELLPSGKQSLFNNRVGWAKTYLKKAGLISSSKRGTLKITLTGEKVLKDNISRIDVGYLKRFKEFNNFYQSNKNENYKKEENRGTEHFKTPDESIEEAYNKLREELAHELLLKVKDCTPEFFERLVIDLLLNMGYGGSRKDAGKAIGKTGDGGIDGIIKEDRLGLDVLYVQAKRWDKTVVGRPEIQKFAGALLGNKARKGIFITTSNFTKEAEDYAGKIESKIVLMDGETLAQYMIDFNVGVSKVATYETKRVDIDYFIEE